MAKTKNGRIMVPIAEAGGVTRVMTSGQRIAGKKELVAKLKRYRDDSRFDAATRTMYADQLDDVKQENWGNG